MDYEQKIEAATGKAPAVLGVTSGWQGSVEDPVKMSNAWIARNGIVELSWAPGATPSGTNSIIPTSQTTTPGTSGYTTWQSWLAAQVAILKQIQGPVLYRPFIELNGNWNWWGPQNFTPQQFIQTWQQMHDYYASHGVTNVLWVYNVNCGSGNYIQYYPGAPYVDIVSEDCYPPYTSDPGYPALVALGKPMMFAEAGVHTANNSQVSQMTYSNEQLLQSVKSNFSKMFGVSIWCQNYGIPVQLDMAALMNDANVVTLADIPAGVVH